MPKREEHVSVVAITTPIGFIRFPLAFRRPKRLAMVASDRKERVLV
jgi:hypothetical protein